MASRARDAKVSRRMLAIALVLDGEDRTTAARSCGMDRQTLRNWVHRYNAEGAEGIEGLSDRRRSGRPGMLSADQKTERAEMVRVGPDPATDGVIRWRRIGLVMKITDRFDVVMHERAVGKHLTAPGFRRLSVRP